MKAWIEEKKIKDYYTWLRDCSDGTLSNCIVRGYNAIQISDYSEFIINCSKWIVSEIPSTTETFFYLICNEEVRDLKSRVERYKKCWKKISDKFDIEKFELGDEFEIEKAGRLYYSAIARFKSDSLENVFKLLKVKHGKYLLFFSKKNYMEDSEKQKKIINEWVSFNDELGLNYTIFSARCISEGDIPLRYGNVGDEAELALIIPDS